MKNYSNKTAKGYRLKPETHNLIKSLQELTSNDADEVLNASCLMYLSFVAGKNFESANQNKENKNLKTY